MADMDVPVPAANITSSCCGSIHRCRAQAPFFEAIITSESYSFSASHCYKFPCALLAPPIAPA
ncbi:hypothetical protein Hanom_Chr07g00598411 [Helianthus anomalus]